MISTSDIANTSTRVGDTVKRVAPSGSDVAQSNTVVESMLDFFLDVDVDVLESADLNALNTLFNDLDFITQVGMNESLHFTKKSTTGARSTSRKWYKANSARVKKLQDKIKKSKALKKKKR